ncbi:MAG: FKBP-type peptidyl-prolyl cis-trans isomerase [Bacteroidota bacterium]
MVLSLLNKFNDSVIYDSWKVNPEGGLAQYYIEEARFRGALEEGILMMSVGDSASFIISADSVLKYFPSEDTTQIYPKGSILTFYIKLVQIRSKAEVKAEYDSLYAEYIKSLEVQYKQRKSEEPLLIAGYITKNNIKAKPSPSGTYYIENKKGKGAFPVKGDKVTVSYVAKFLDGTIFDSSLQSGYFIFTIGNNEAIKGFEESILKSKIGTKATVVIPSSAAYGVEGFQDEQTKEFIILPYTPLIYEFEVIKIN